MGSLSDYAEFGIVGLGVMGRNLAQNVRDQGFKVAVYNWISDVTQEFIGEHPDFVGTVSYEDFAAVLTKPRRVLIMVTAGAPVDSVLDNLIEVLEEGDIVIDGGNSWFQHTREREKRARAAGIRFFGMGVSGGEEGARFGPALMPGGDKAAYEELAPVLTAIAAKTKHGPCVTHLGSDGAGHFVKMVHNGIEYADMQFIAEAYDFMQRVLGMDAAEIGEVFANWNTGPLESFLIEITAKIFANNDADGRPLVHQVLDKAGQKGTGRWTAQIALELGVSIPSIAASIDARVLSSMREERLVAETVLAGPQNVATVDADGRGPWLEALHDALLAAKIGAYAQGMALIRTASQEYGWGTNLVETARIWTGGCIIRARFLETMMEAFQRSPELPNLLLDPGIAATIKRVQADWRRVVTTAIGAGIPMPAMAASLAYYDSYRTGRLPQNLTQAQRDAFGAHTYQRVDDADGAFVHTDWLDFEKTSEE